MVAPVLHELAGEFHGVPFHTRDAGRITQIHGREHVLHTTSQNPHLARLILSAFVNIAPEHKLRVIAPDVGGGFGSKIFVYAEEAAVIWASRKIGRAVKWTADRNESFLADAHGRDHPGNQRSRRRQQHVRGTDPD